MRFTIRSLYKYLIVIKRHNGAAKRCLLQINSNANFATCR